MGEGIFEMKLIRDFSKIVFLENLWVSNYIFWIISTKSDFLILKINISDKENFLKNLKNFAFVPALFQQNEL